MRRYLIVIVSLLGALPAPAADKPLSAEARARAVAPFLDESAIAVIHIDANRLDLEALVSFISKMDTKIPKEEFATLEGMDKVRSAFVKAGGRSLYLVLSLA